MISAEAVETAHIKISGTIPAVLTRLTEKFDLAGYLDHNGIRYKIKQTGTTNLYVLHECLFDSGHGPGEASIGQTAEGKIFYQCFHDSCQHTWKEARELISGAENLDRFVSGAKKPETSGDILRFLYIWNDIASMEISTEWLLEKIIPKGAITLLFCPGGGGKTWLMMQLGQVIAIGALFGNLHTLQVQVYYIDFENPLSVVKERCEKIGPATGFFYWHPSCEMEPPKLDSENWTLYKELPPGLIIFDTLRASHNGDENSSKDMALVLSRLKELRDMGFTIVVLHHTPKGNDGTYKGSTAILDLADHILSLERQGKNKDEEFNPDSVFKFGCRMKTRFEPHEIFLSFDPKHGFSSKADPDIATMMRIQDILMKEGSRNQTDLLRVLENKLGLNKNEALKLLKKGTDTFWETERGSKNSIQYSSLPSSFPVVPPYKGVENRKTESGGPVVEGKHDDTNSTKTLDAREFASSQKGDGKTKKQDDDAFVHEGRS